MYTSRLTLVYLVSVGVAATAALLTWRRRDAPGARSLALMILAAALWTTLDAVELQAATVPAKRLVSQVQYLAVVATAPLFLHAAASLSHR
ncbi:MAG TPA: histidine kinase N-terminal 7TM domain-containing protein, partial [Longimicrobiales bacterium]|nr:histidine kinase N-terminal 7TM domain-containing protein [Longimicrobiales bacterium]